jgi:Uma2 family endonuclease
MAILEHEVRSAAEPNATGLNRHLYTRDEYYRVAEAGVFDQSRVELIEGEIIEMAPMGDSHAAIPEPLVVILQAAFGPSASVRNQMPVRLGDDARPSEPEPDIAVVAGTWRDYLSRKAGSADIKLLVEIADSTLAYDWRVKAALYAAAGVPEYWIVNLVDVQLEIHRDPSATGYRTILIRKSGESVEPLLAPNKTIAVADFMP